MSSSSSYFEQLDIYRRFITFFFQFFLFLDHYFGVSFAMRNKSFGKNQANQIF